MKAQADRVILEAKAVTEKFSSSSGKTVVDFTIFRRNKADGLVVATGWSYRSASDPSPSLQNCYIERDSLTFDIARDGIALPFSSLATQAGFTWNGAQKALPYCTWFKGANPNIQDSKAGRS
jgi:hypothetical protein